MNPTDAELLVEYVARRDGATFAAIVARHGAMVLATAARVLNSWHDAEDVHQATFLILARKPEAVRPPVVLGGWLHAVAVRVALDLRRAERRRQAREVRANREWPMSGVEVPEISDLRAALDEELCRLPDKYRQVVVLCDLDGRGRAQVAAELGLAEGTVSSRLATARQMLAARFRRRGLVLTVALLALLLSTPPAVAAPPPPPPLGAGGNSRAERLAARYAGRGLSKLTKLVGAAAAVVVLLAGGVLALLNGLSAPVLGPNDFPPPVEAVIAPPAPGPPAGRRPADAKRWVVRPNEVTDLQLFAVPFELAGYGTRHVVFLKDADFQLDRTDRLRCLLRAVLMPGKRVDVTVTVTVYAADGRRLGSAPHTERVERAADPEVKTMAVFEYDFGQSPGLADIAWATIEVRSGTDEP